MAEKAQLGIYWGNNTLYFVQNGPGAAPKAAFSVLLSKNNQPGTIDPNAASLITKALNQNSIKPSAAHLSLPVKDIIFRSFIIPWMQPNEIKTAINFEAVKYIPFSINELSYTYYPVTVTEKGTKRIRVIFVAIKKSTLATYKTLLEQVGIQLHVIEPAPLSLTRILSIKNLLPKDQTVAIVEKTENSGKITILDNDVVHFVREFPILPSASEKGPDAVSARLIGEIRISLDYFSRQASQLEVKQVLFLVSLNAEKYDKKIEESLHLPVKTVQAQDFFKTNIQNDLHFFHAYGAALISTSGSPVYFNFGPKQWDTYGKKAASIGGEETPLRKAASTATICALIIGVAFSFSMQRLSTHKQQIKDIDEKLGTFRGVSIEKISEKNETMRNSIEQLKSLDLKSRAAVYLATIPTLLPEGAWIKELDIGYFDPSEFKGDREPEINRKNKKRSNEALNNTIKPMIDLSGYVYLQDQPQQIAIVNQFMRNLKNNEAIAQSFPMINLETVRAESWNNNDLTFFKINFQ